MTHQYFTSRVDASASVEERLLAHMRDICASVGLGTDAVVQKCMHREQTRYVARAVFDSLERDGVTIRGARVLDDGTGPGTLAVEAAVRGAESVGLEPGRELCAIAQDRLRDVGGYAICDSGEALPFPDESFDVVTSVMVLEHVENPLTYLREAYRVLKPGAHLYLACENYLCFREQHYQIAWLPLLPKWLGRIYLRMRGRPTGFLMSSITYTTVPGVLRMLRRCGFELVSEIRLREKIAASGSLPVRVARTVLGVRRMAALIVWARYMSRAMSPGVYALARRRVESFL